MTAAIAIYIVIGVALAVITAPPGVEASWVIDFIDYFAVVALWLPLVMGIVLHSIWQARRG